MKHILYTEEEGGDFHVIGGDDAYLQDLFDKTVKSKILVYSTGDGDRVVKIRPAYMEIVETTHEYDFVLGSSRADYGKSAKKEKDAK